uniref:Uncharacterized protein n=1 Tax=Romanomermis culicivorax TaxID=13658 RepID=A0A915HIM9_ROMCU
MEIKCLTTSANQVMKRSVIGIGSCIRMEKTKSVKNMRILEKMDEKKEGISLKICKCYEKFIKLAKQRIDNNIQIQMKNGGKGQIKLRNMEILRKNG